MTQPNRFALTVDLLAQLDEGHASVPAASPSLPTLNDVLAEYSPLPRAALFLGVANDGLPVLLNLLDPVPGPILIVGDAEAGKTRLLQMIARSLAKADSTSNIRYGVLTPRPEDWQSLQPMDDRCDGILSPGDSAASNYLNALVNWGHENKGENQIVVLLMDQLDACVAADSLKQSLPWLFLRGPSRRIWPVVTMNPAHARNVSSWLDSFHTRLFGCMSNAEASAFAGNSLVNSQDLIRGSQFVLREGNNWLPFWIPR